jgi:hypothetical protein
MHETTEEKVVITGADSLGSIETAHRLVGVVLTSLFLCGWEPAIASAQDAVTPILNRGDGAWTSTVVAEGLDYP